MTETFLAPPCFSSVLNGRTPGIFCLRASRRCMRRETRTGFYALTLRACAVDALVARMG